MGHEAHGGPKVLQGHGRALHFVRLMRFASVRRNGMSLQEDAPSVGVHGAQGEVDEGGFAAAGGADEGDRLAALKGEVEVLERGAGSAGVGEVEVSEFQGFGPVGGAGPGFRDVGVAQGFGEVQHLKEPLRRRIAFLQVVEGHGNRLEGRDELVEEEQVGHEGSSRQPMAEQNFAATVKQDEQQGKDADQFGQRARQISTAVHVARRRKGPLVDPLKAFLLVVFGLKSLEDTQPADAFLEGRKDLAQSVLRRRGFPF